MLSILQEVWTFFHNYILPVLPFLAIVLIEIHLMYNHRKEEVMFGTDAFNEKIKAFEFTPVEVSTLNELVRSSKFENMDAVLNSSLLFEKAVNEYYRVHNVFSIRDEKLLDAIASLRQKMGFTGANPLAMVCSTRQFDVGDCVDLEHQGSIIFKRAKIIDRTERSWSVEIEGSLAQAKALLGERVLVRWTRMNDAVYSTSRVVITATPKKLVFYHGEHLDKEQLRKWVREVVDFPVEATFPDGQKQSGVLYDLSAGGILLGLSEDCKPDQKISISFELPTFGVQNVDVKVLNNLGRRNPDFPMYNSISAVFTGAYAWTQERVLQYIFEVNRKTKTQKTVSKSISS